MNVMTDDATQIAQVVKDKMDSSRVSHTVYVDRSGAVILDRTHDPRRGWVPPEWLVGVYTRAGSTRERIAADLEARRDELGVAA